MSARRCRSASTAARATGGGPGLRRGRRRSGAASRSAAGSSSTAAAARWPDGPRGGCGACRRRPRGRRDPAFADGARGRPRGALELHVVDTMHQRKRLMAERSDAFVAPARRHRHLRGTVRGLDLAPARLPRQAGRPAQRRRLLRRPARLPRRDGGAGIRLAAAARAAAGVRRPGAAAGRHRRGAPRATAPTITAASERPRARLNSDRVLRWSRRCGCAPPARPA